MFGRKSFIKRLIIMLAVNTVALYVATIFITGVDIPLAREQFAIVIGVLTLINLFLRPVIRLVLTPIIILTFGLGSILVNAVTLYVLDFLLPAVTIEGFIALLLTALIVSISGLVINLSARIL